MSYISQRFWESTSFTLFFLLPLGFEADCVVRRDCKNRPGFDRHTSCSVSPWTECNLHIGICCPLAASSAARWNIDLGKGNQKYIERKYSEFLFFHVFFPRSLLTVTELVVHNLEYSRLQMPKKCDAKVDNVVRTEQNDQDDKVANLRPVQNVQEALVQPLQANQGGRNFFAWN